MDDVRLVRAPSTFLIMQTLVESSDPSRGATGGLPRFHYAGSRRLIRAVGLVAGARATAPASCRGSTRRCQAASSSLVLNRSVHGYTKAIPPPVNQTLHFPPTVTMARIDQAVTRVLEPMFRMGLFDSDRQFLPLNTTAKNVTSAAHNLVARKLARAGMGERDRLTFLSRLAFSH